MTPPHTKSPYLIALIGPKGCGKSTLAKQLIQANPNFIRLRFAEPIKLMLKILFSYQGASEEEINNLIEGVLKEMSTKYLLGSTPRHAMQTLGTEWRDFIHKELWSNILFNTAKVTLSKGKSVIIDDMRFLHEEKVIDSLSGIIIKINRKDHFPGDHASEKEYLKIKPHHEINNLENNPREMLNNLNYLLSGNILRKIL